MVDICIPFILPFADASAKLDLQKRGGPVCACLNLMYVVFVNVVRLLCTIYFGVFVVCLGFIRRFQSVAELWLQEATRTSGYTLMSEVCFHGVMRDKPAAGI